MDGVEGSGIRLSKRFAGGKVTGGSLEVDYKEKSGTAWSHSFLNQKPWHPLSYPNQRRKWIAEQTHAQHDRRAEEVAREFAQEEEFFKQAALISKKEREKIETMKAVSFMYVRPPGYDPESAKAAEYADEKHKGQGSSAQDPMADDNVGSKPEESLGGDHSGQERKKRRPKDVFGRSLPTEEEFDVLKNAPRLETGIAGRAKPFAVELRNVKCLRCGNFGHQSGDRECPLKDAVMPNEELRLKRDDPLTAIIAHTDPSEPLKWELKQKPGLSPPRGGFDLDDPNQQIVAEDIFDEYGGFLEGSIPLELLKDMSSDKKRKSKKNKKHKKHSSRTVEESDESSTGSEDSGEKRGSKKRKKLKKKSKKHYDSESLSSEDSDSDSYRRSRRRHTKHVDPFATLKSEVHHQGNSHREKHSKDEKHQKQKKMVDTPSASSDDHSDYYRNHSSKKKSSKDDYKIHHRERKQVHNNDPVSEKSQKHDSLESGKLHRVEKERYNERRDRYVDAESEKRHRSEKKSRYEDLDSERHHRSVKGKEHALCHVSDHPEEFSDRYRSSNKKVESDSDSNRRSRKKKQKHELPSEEEEESRKHRYSTNRRRN
ncbi:putative zinc finger CCHC domain-containing protein [Cardamine amara subsp. amara]|uniref:Zinc finger CCHC domain-containing protein n=1 Tax=Cardamine amara subsp. amara TaxID=228776 RepID=A0ABD1C5I4_CARAN